MHPLPLVVFLTLAAGPDRTIPVGCREDFRTCREDCTIDYGGSTAKYRQLTQCMDRCTNEQDECTTRHYSLRDANIDPLPPREQDAAMREPAPASGSVPHDGVRRGVYRAAESDPPAQVEPAVMKEPEPEPAPEPEPEPLPPSRPASAAQSKRAPAPATKKKGTKGDDIRIFDDPAAEPEATPEPEPEPAPAPKPAPKPAEPLRPKPPPEPKKKDISDWDPNAD